MPELRWSRAGFGAMMLLLVIGCTPHGEVEAPTEKDPEEPAASSTTESASGERDREEIQASAEDVTESCSEDSWCLTETGSIDSNLVAIDGTGPENIIAVGTEATILHWTGDGWERPSV